MLRLLTPAAAGKKVVEIKSNSAEYFFNKIKKKEEDYDSEKSQSLKIIIIDALFSHGNVSEAPSQEISFTQFISAGGMLRKGVEHNATGNNYRAPKRSKICVTPAHFCGRIDVTNLRRTVTLPVSVCHNWRLYKPGLGCPTPHNSMEKGGTIFFLFLDPAPLPQHLILQHFCVRLRRGQRKSRPLRGVADPIG